jgi:hypothetical protein
MPGWLVELVRPVVEAPDPRPRPTDAAVGRRDAWAAAALTREAARTRQAREGSRNHTLNRAAFALGQLVAGGHLDADQVTVVLTEAALAAGLGLRETRATIASGLRAAATRPRHPAAR